MQPLKSGNSRNTADQAASFFNTLHEGGKVDEGGAADTYVVRTQSTAIVMFTWNCWLILAANKHFLLQSLYHWVNTKKKSLMWNDDHWPRLLQQYDMAWPWQELNMIILFVFDRLKLWCHSRNVIFFISRYMDCGAVVIKRLYFAHWTLLQYSATSALVALVAAAKPLDFAAC